MPSRSLAAMRAGALILCWGTAWIGAAADQPVPAPPPDLVERTSGPWIDIYTGWLETRDGRAVPVDPGPGFCLGTDGLVLIDQDAVAGSVHQFATIRGRGPFAARTRAFDPVLGLAAIQINPKALEGVRCLPRAGEDAATVARGDVLFALGPAGSEPTPLHVKKVAPDALSFEEGLPATFLAGSPLVDANGLVRGVLVAGTKGGRIGKTEATGALAGLAQRRHASRAIPVASALALVEQVKKQRDAGAPVPPAGPIVRVSVEVFPKALRAEPVVSEEDLRLYSAKTDDAGVEFLTPRSLEAQGGVGALVYVPGKLFFRADRHDEMWEPMVVVQQAPQFAPIGASAFTFPKSLGSITVERSGERFEPFDSFVDCVEDSIVIETGPGIHDRRTVKGCRTFYLFPPRAFAPGADVLVRVTLDKNGKAAAVPVRPETQTRIAADFAPWQAAAEKSAEAPPSDVEMVLVPTPDVPYAMKFGGNTRLQIFTQEGYTYFATRLKRDGATLISVPLILMKWGPRMIFGFLFMGRDEISFAPLGDPNAEGISFKAPRASVAVSTTGWPRLELELSDKTWAFDPVVTGMRKLSLGEVFFGAAMKEARTAAVQMSAWLLGDFDRALRAFDEPELLKGVLAKPVAPKAAAGEEAP